ncbi:MAG TPA: ATP-binding protein [Ktedonobacterales bacterium]
MASGYQRPPAPGEWPEPAQPSGTIGTGADIAKGYANRHAITALCQEALDGALALVRADGGELALLDATEPVLVTRARRSHPPRVARAGFGAPSYPSQPLRGDSIPDDPLGSIDDQITQLLPSAQLARVHKLGQGLVGMVWKRREPAILRPDNTPPDARQSLLLEQDAPQHLAVPIFFPERLDRVSARGTVIGVLRVFTRDEMWSYTTNDARLLELHADRLARALELLDAPPLTVRQDDLAAMLRELNRVSPTQEEILTQVVEVIHRDHPTLAVAALMRSGEEVVAAHAMRRGVRRQGDRVPQSDIPPGVRRALQGELMVEPSPPAAANAPIFARLGWDGTGPLQATLAAPIGTSPRILGALFVSAPPGEGFTPDLSARLEAVALAAASFLENARLVLDARRSVERIDERKRQFEERNRQLSALTNAVLTLNTSLDEADNLQNLAEQANTGTPDRVAAVFVRDDEHQTLVCRAVSPLDFKHHDTLLGAVLPLNWNKLGKTLDESDFHVIQAATDDDSAPNDGADRLRDAEAVSFLAMPIIRQDKQLGALTVFTPNKPAQYSPAETAFFVSLASQAAVAISNARLYRQLEEAYEQQKELDRLKDDFILTVSHEFRTPLTAIEGYVTLIGRHGQKLDPEKLGAFAGEIRQATSQLAGMISMLADASRLSNQALRVTTRTVSLASMADVAIGRQPPEAKARIQSRIDETLWVLADDERLPLIFSNLLSNALKYSGGDKPCRVSARALSRADLGAQRQRVLEESAPEQWVVVTVEDEGPGISVEDQARLFHKFVRLQRSLTTAVRGTGLGLWICRQYVEAMGGEIWVDSRPGRGARFSFSLPRAAAPAAES